MFEIKVLLPKENGATRVVTGKISPWNKLFRLYSAIKISSGMMPSSAADLLLCPLFNDKYFFNSSTVIEDYLTTKERVARGQAVLLRKFISRGKCIFVVR